MSTIYNTETNPKISDIQYFYNKLGTRSDNDELNKIRENCLCYLPNISKEYLEDVEYGKQWRKIKEDFDLVLLKIRPEQTYDNLTILRKGGRNNNYDFDFIFENNKESIKKKIEFKFNNDNINKLPQFLELHDSSVDICSITYTEYFYAMYLDDYLKTDEMLINSKIDFESYIKNVNDIYYKHPFFDLLYSRKDFYKKEKHAIVAKSLKDYNYSFQKQFNFTKIENKIKEQNDKIYLLWNNDNFTTQKVDTSKIEIKNIIVIKDKYFDVDVHGIQNNIRVRLNWGNNNGIANPRWKFSYIKKNNVKS